MKTYRERAKGEITVLVNSKGQYIVLHYQTVLSYFSNYEYVQLLYKDRAGEIRIKPVKSYEPDSVVLSYISKNTRILRSRLFFRNKDSSFLKGKYKASWNRAAKCLVIKKIDYLGG